MTLRLFILQANYRKPLDFTNEALQAATQGWKGLNVALLLGVTHSQAARWPKSKQQQQGAIKQSEDFLDETCIILNQQFIDLMNDDLNTSGALAILFELARPLRALANRLERKDIKTLSSKESKTLYNRWQLLVRLAGVLGLKAEEVQTYSHTNQIAMREKIEEAIQARKEAKSKKDFAKADQIRDELKSLGVEIIDKPGGDTDWIQR